MAIIQRSFTQLPRLYLDDLTNYLKTQSKATNALTVGAVSVASFAIWVISDYHAWKAFGTGGTPPTWPGYWRMTKIRINRLFSSDSMRDYTRLQSEGLSYLSISLPNRTQTRPRIQSRTMPQRQIPNKPKLSVAAHERLHSIPRRFVSDHPALLNLDLSATEGRSTDAIYSRNTPVVKDRILKAEIAHVHPAEDSLHVWLSEPDARKVIESGWGERFPLSAMGMCHQGWTFLYAPKDLKDVEVIEEITKAGVAFVTGQRI